jgi:hypothetical protein
MRRWSMMLVLGMLAACGDPPPCGVDDDGDDIAVCNDAGTLYCPLDNWIAADGCNVCGCSPQGEVICNDRAECAGGVPTDTGLVTGSTATTQTTATSR